MNKQCIPPAQLWIGDQSTLSYETERFLQQHYCTQNSCNICTNCLQIRNRQHHSIIWIQPSKRYTTDDLKPLFQAVSFSLEHNEKMFIVLQDADTLGLSCGNSLLKTIEEPPAGYHIILLARHMDDVLPTIRSRCTVNRYQHNETVHQYENLLKQFTHTEQQDMLTFYQILESAIPTETETKELVDTIFTYWKKRYSQTLSKQNHKNLPLIKKMLSVLTKSMNELPMPGSSKLFWKNLFLRSYSEAHIS